MRAAKFAPLGERSIAGGLPHLRFRTFSATETIQAMNEATMVIIMIESAEALAKVDEIAAVEGVDLLLIGTNDLCSSLGIPGQLDHEKVRSAYAKAIEACRRHGKHLGVGGLSSQPSLTAEFVKMGPIRLHRNRSSLSSRRRDCESKTSPRILKRNWKFRLVFGRRITRTGPRWIAPYPCSISCV